VDQFNIVGGKNCRAPLALWIKTPRYPVSSTLLTDEPCTLQRVPELAESAPLLKLLETLGKKFRFRRKSRHHEK